MTRKNSYFRRRRRQNKRFLLTIVSVLVLAFGFLSIYNQNYQKQMASLDKDIASTQAKKDELDKEIKSLKDDYKNRNTDEFKEKIARERLNMVKKSEVVYEDENN